MTKGSGSKSAATHAAPGAQSYWELWEMLQNAHLGVVPTEGLGAGLSVFG